MKGNICKQRIQLDSNSLIIARKIALVGDSCITIEGPGGKRA